MGYLEGGSEEWAVDFGAAWSEELAVLESLWDVEWPGCEVLVELLRKGKWEIKINLLRSK